MSNSLAGPLLKLVPDSPFVQSLAGVAEKFFLYGFVGWAVENAIAPNETGAFPAPTTLRYSKTFRGAKVPLFPAYGIGGLAVEGLAKAMRRKHVSVLARAVVYAATLTGIEWAGCRINRAMGPWSHAGDWSYSGELGASPDGCVSLVHTAAFTGLALLLEQVV